jgi:hypothetical protein
MDLKCMIVFFAVIFFIARGPCAVINSTDDIKPGSGAA